MKKKKLSEPESFQIENNSDTSKQIIDDKESKINDLVNDYKEEKKEAKEKRVRKPKADNKETQEFIALANIQASIGLDILLSRMPKPQPLSDIERQNFDKAFTQLAYKYYESMNKYGIEFQFGIALILILLPRIDFDKIRNGKNSNNLWKNRNGKNSINEVVNISESNKQNNNN